MGLQGMGSPRVGVFKEWGLQGLRTGLQTRGRAATQGAGGVSAAPTSQKIPNLLPRLRMGAGEIQALERILPAPDCHTPGEIMTRGKALTNGLGGDR